MRQIKRNNFGRFYVVPKADDHKIFGVRPLHCYSCGFIGDNELLYIFWDLSELPDTQGERQEMFDFSAIDGDAISASPLVQFAMSGQGITEASKELLSGFCASTAQTVWNDVLNGWSAFDILFNRLGILVNQCVGETWEEVLYENPTWLVETTTTDEGGSISTTYNIEQPIFRGHI